LVNRHELMKDVRGGPSVAPAEAPAAFQGELDPITDRKVTVAALRTDLANGMPVA
jgi:hypothetical protein